jgi:hypothetical protein
VSTAQQSGSVAQSTPLLVPPLSPWRYLWLYALASGSGAAAWWTGPPSGTPDLQLTAGQWQLVDTGEVNNWSLWVRGTAQWVADVDPIANQLGTSGQVTGAVAVSGGAGAPVAVSQVAPSLISSFVFTNPASGDVLVPAPGVGKCIYLSAISFGDAGGGVVTEINFLSSVTSVPLGTFFTSGNAGPLPLFLYENLQLPVNEGIVLSILGVAPSTCVGYVIYSTAAPGSQNVT